MTGPTSPVVVTLAEMTAIKFALTERAHAYRRRADAARGSCATHDRVTFREHADKLDDIAARLSFATPGEAIYVATGRQPDGEWCRCPDIPEGQQPHVHPGCGKDGAHAHHGPAQAVDA